MASNRELRCCDCWRVTDRHGVCGVHGYRPCNLALWGHEWAAVAWMQGAVLECLTLIAHVQTAEDDHWAISESAVRTEIAQWSAPYERRT